MFHLENAVQVPLHNCTFCICSLTNIILFTAFSFLQWTTLLVTSSNSFNLYQSWVPSGINCVAVDNCIENAQSIILYNFVIELPPISTHSKFISIKIVVHIAVVVKDVLSEDLELILRDRSVFMVFTDLEI